MARATLAVLALFVMACGDNEAPPTTVSETTASGDEEVTTPVEQPDPAPPAAASDGDVVVVPGQSVGPVRLGMSLAQFEALGLPRHPRYSAMTIPYTAYFEHDDRVSSVEVSLRHSPGNVVVGDVVIEKTATVDEAVAALGDCEPPDARVGGTHIRCRNRGLSISIGSGDPDEIWIRVPAPE